MKLFTSLMTIALLLQNLFILPSDTSGFEYPNDDIFCESVLMVDAETGDTMYSKNSEAVLPIASITKIMTFIVAVENIPDIENTYSTFSNTVNQILANAGCWTAHIKVGEQFSILDYLKMLLVTSAGDAGIQIALYYDELQGYSNPYVGLTKGVDTRAFIMEGSPFVALMNEKAQELGCTNTHFANPTGLHHETNYSTAEDIAIFTEYARTLPYFKDIVCLSEFQLPETNLSAPRTISTSNALLSPSLYGGIYTYQYTTGIKTGRLDAAGNCLVSSAKKDGREYIVIALGAEIYNSKNDSAGDAIKLYNWVFDTFSEQYLISEGDFVTEIDIKNNYTTTKLSVIAGDTAVSYLPNDFNLGLIDIDVQISEDINAPINENDVLGTASFSYNDYMFGSVELVASKSINKISDIKFFNENVHVERDYRPVIVLSMLAFLTICIIILFIIIHTKKKAKRKRSKNHQ